MSGFHTVSNWMVRLCFYAYVHLHGGPAPVRRYLPQLINLVWNKTIDPSKVFDHLASRPGRGGYRAMDERRTIKTLLRPRRPQRERVLK